MHSSRKEWFKRLSENRRSPGCRTNIGVAFLLAALIAFATGCGGCKDNAGGGANGGNSAGVSGDQILVGEFASMTGSTSTFGIATHEGIQLAIDEVNAAGGINGKQIKLITEDDRSKPEEATTVVTKLVTQDNVAAATADVATDHVRLYKALGGGWTPGTSEASPA